MLMLPYIYASKLAIDEIICKFKDIGWIMYLELFNSFW